MAFNASRIDPAAPCGSPAMIAPAANTSGYVASSDAVIAPAANAPRCPAARLPPTAPSSTTVSR